MKLNWLIRISVISFFTISVICQAVENPNVGRSSGSRNTVPSSGQQQRKAPQPTAGGNDVVTGNVAGSRYFRGVVPYGSTYYSGANLNDSGSSSVNSFIRRSVNPVVSDRNPGQSRAYFQPSRTTSTFRRQTSGIGVSGSTSLNMATGRTRNSTYDLPDLPPATSATSDYAERPLSSNNLDLDLILSRQFALKEAAKSVDRNIVKDRSAFKDFFEDLPPLPQKDDTQQGEKDAESDKTPTVTRPELKVLKEFQKEADEGLLEQESARVSLRQQRLDAEKAAEEAKDTADDASPDTQLQRPDPMDKIDARLKNFVEARKIRGEHKTFESLAQAKFADYMQAAEQFIVDGKYYKAADAYDLATIWISDDPRPYAGKSFTLFAAGEYMSSAYYLGRAIELNASIASKEVDIAKLLGDRDTYENRLMEISTWQQRSGSGELAFLMAYLYHHDGKAAKAAAAIEQARQAMPDSIAVAALANMITGQ